MVHSYGPQSKCYKRSVKYFTKAKMNNMCVSSLQTYAKFSPSPKDLYCIYWKKSFASLLTKMSRDQDFLHSNLVNSNQIIIHFRSRKHHRMSILIISSGGYFTQ